MYFDQSDWEPGMDMTEKVIVGLMLCAVAMIVALLYAWAY